MATKSPAARRITRFQVMAVLQAARARTFGLTLSEAKSWGLNRALFYAAAKQGWMHAKAIGARRAAIPEVEASLEHHDPVYALGGEKAYRDRDYSNGLRFKFGDLIQTPEAFDRQIKRRFGKDWARAWAEAVAIIGGSDRRDLDIQSRFFNRVYKVRRDTLAERWSHLSVTTSDSKELTDDSKAA